MLTAAVVGVLLGALFVGLLVFVRRTPAAWIRVPNEAYWTAAENEPRLRRMLTADTAALGAATLLLLSVGQILTVQATFSDPVALSPLFAVALAVYVATLLGGAISAHRRYTACRPVFMRRADR